MVSLTQRICIALTALAVACAQLFGVQRGYICFHGDIPVATISAHCDEASHNGHHAESLCEDLEAGDFERHGEEHTHPALKGSLQGVASSGGSPIAPLLIAVQLTSPARTRHEAMAVRAAIVLFHRIAPDRPPSLAVQVAHCEVILV